MTTKNKPSEVARRIHERYTVTLATNLNMFFKLIEGGHYQAASELVEDAKAVVTLHNDFLLETIGILEKEDSPGQGGVDAV